ncbi:MAG: TIR domain-containing protein [Sandarakinorhabdus sp.]|nr:TIR domain-containing protein [Sandarakinorhabdus sp.]
MPGETNTATTVFLSYSRDDRKRALPVIQLLEAAGFSVWWDGKLEGGERFAATTAHALETARAVVVLWSKTSINSHWVHDEATRGRDRKCLVPLSLDGSMPPLGFGQFQVIDISRSRLKRGDPAADAMLRAVAALHDGADPASPSSLATAGGAQTSRRGLLIGGVAAVAAAGAGVAVWRAGWLAPAAAEAAPASVAVLPFANLSNDPEQAYFSDGLAAEVRAELARNPGLLVAAQASSNRFRTRGADAREMARQLGVAWLLDGSVRRSDTSLRIAAELIDGRTGFSQWSEQYERPITDVFAVQDDIARAVATALEAQIGGDSPDEPGTTAGSAARAIGGTSNVAAYDALLRGRELFAMGADEGTDRAALARFDEALRLDAAYGAAHAARSRALSVIGNQHTKGAQRADIYAEAIAAATRAVSLAPQLADAHSALGFALFNGQLDARAARGPFDRSAELGQGDADVMSRFALFSARTGRFEDARKAIARATTLDPLNARAFRLAGEVEYAARNYAGAIAPIEKALALNPKMGVARAAIGFTRLAQNDLAAAEAAFRAEPNSLFALTGLAIVLRRRGDGAGASAALARLKAEHGDLALYQQAQVLAQWNDGPAALAMLQRARASRDAGLVYLRNDPLLDPIRAQPGFDDLRKSIGFV